VNVHGAVGCPLDNVSTAADSGVLPTGPPPFATGRTVTVESSRTPPAGIWIDQRASTSMSVGRSAGTANRWGCATGVPGTAVRTPSPP